MTSFASSREKGNVNEDNAIVILDVIRINKYILGTGDLIRNDMQSGNYTGLHFCGLFTDA